MPTFFKAVTTSHTTRSLPEFVNHSAVLRLIGPTNDIEILERMWSYALRTAHPDRGGSNEELTFVNAAREVLREEERRNEYMHKYRRFFEGNSPPYPLAPPPLPETRARHNQSVRVSSIGSRG